MAELQLALDTAYNQRNWVHRILEEDSSDKATLSPLDEKESVLTEKCFRTEPCHVTSLGGSFRQINIR